MFGLGIIDEVCRLNGVAEVSSSTGWLLLYPYMYNGLKTSGPGSDKS
jgi:hypothetical protein